MKENLDNLTLTQLQCKINKKVELLSKITGSLYSGMIIDEINDILLKGYDRAKTCNLDELNLYWFFRTKLWSHTEPNVMGFRDAFGGRIVDHPYIKIPEDYRKFDYKTYKFVD